MTATWKMCQISRELHT